MDTGLRRHDDLYFNSKCQIKSWLLLSLLSLCPSKGFIPNTSGTGALGGRLRFLSSFVISLMYSGQYCVYYGVWCQVKEYQFSDQNNRVTWTKLTGQCSRRRFAKSVPVSDCKFTDVPESIRHRHFGDRGSISF